MMERRDWLKTMGAAAGALATVTIVPTPWWVGVHEHDFPVLIELLTADGEVAGSATAMWSHGEADGDIWKIKAKFEAHDKVSAYGIRWHARDGLGLEAEGPRICAFRSTKWLGPGDTIEVTLALDFGGLPVEEMIRRHNGAIFEDERTT